RAIGLRIEKEVRQMMSRKMLGAARARCSDNALCRNTGCLSLAPQICDRLEIVFEQPENARVGRAKQPHPNREDLRRNFEIVIETAIYKRALGQSRAATG